MGVADKERERRRGRKGRRRRDAQQTPDSVSPLQSEYRGFEILGVFYCVINQQVFSIILLLSVSQCSLHHPPGGVGVVWRVCHGHLLRSGTH